jgi:hypothetical protein
MAFYRQRHEPWEIIEDDSVMLVLQQAERRLAISASDEGFGRGTVIAYDLYGDPATGRRR